VPERKSYFSKKPAQNQEIFFEKSFRGGKNDSFSALPSVFQNYQ
jgi:hypothetical protein